MTGRGAKRCERGRRRVVRGSSILLVFLAVGATAGASSAAAALCPNEMFRVGASASLPDCRAYELVSPPDAGAHRPTSGPIANVYHAFESPLITVSGDSVLFNSVTGALPGLLGTGFEDRYRSRRGSTGWVTELFGTTGLESERNNLGSASPDHEYGTFRLQRFVPIVPNDGLLVTAFDLDEGGDLIRRPDGSYELMGVGSKGVDLKVDGKLLTPGATHMVFESDVKLEENAPPSGKITVYDRTIDGTHVVSLLPGDLPATDLSLFTGASADGTVIGFKHEGSQYVRIDNDETLLVTSNAAAVFGGISADGSEVFYLLGGDIFSFNTAAQTTTQITNVGDAQIVNLPANGSHVYFVSGEEIDGEGGAGDNNLYVWDRATDVTTFIGTLSAEDVSDLHPEPEAEGSQNLVNWVEQTAARFKDWNLGAAYNVSRTTPDGAVLVFESTAQLTAFDNDGNVEIYRYDATADSLECVSCGPGVGPASGDASLQAFFRISGDTIRPLTAVNPIRNVTDDGSTVFFETTDQLVAGDVTDSRDIYRWKDGEVALISSGDGSLDNYLYATTPTGSDVVFLTYDHLLPQDENTIGALYDARAGGGFPIDDPVLGPCVEDACQGQSAAAPNAARVGSSSLTGKGNVKAKKMTRRCPKGKRKVRRRGKTRCVSRRGHQGRQAGSGRRASR
jgi:hypothetical protein